MKNIQRSSCHRAIVLVVIAVGTWGAFARSPQFNAPYSAQLLHFRHQLLRRLDALRDVGAHAQRAPPAGDVELEEHAPVAAMA